MLICIHGPRKKEKEYPQISKRKKLLVHHGTNHQLWAMARPVGFNARHPPTRSRQQQHEVHERRPQRSLPVPSPRNQSQSKNPEKLITAIQFPKSRKIPPPRSREPLRSANTLVENRKSTQTFKKHAEKDKEIEEEERTPGQPEGVEKRRRGGSAAHGNPTQLNSGEDATARVLLPLPPAI